MLNFTLDKWLSNNARALVEFSQSELSLAHLTLPSPPFKRSIFGLGSFLIPHASEHSYNLTFKLFSFQFLSGKRDSKAYRPIRETVVCEGNFYSENKKRTKTKCRPLKWWWRYKSRNKCGPLKKFTFLTRHRLALKHCNDRFFFVNVTLVRFVTPHMQVAQKQLHAWHNFTFLSHLADWSPNQVRRRIIREGAKHYSTWTFGSY